jgi:hypothetical protein
MDIYEKKIIDNIKWRNTKTLLFAIAVAIVPHILFAVGISGIAGKDLLIFSILFGLAAAGCDVFIIKALIMIIDPLSNKIFKKYGSLENLRDILIEIESTIQFEDNKVIISNNYIMRKKNYESILAFDDILSAHKQVHKTNGFIDSYSVIVTDKYGLRNVFEYSSKEEEKVNVILFLIGMKSKNAVMGFTKQAFDHVKNSKVDLNSK